MAKFECSVCGYIFDEQQAGIKFSEITECPICAESKDKFKKIEEEEKEKAEEKKDEDKGYVIEKRQEFWLEEKDKDDKEVDKSNIETYYEGVKPVKSPEQLEREAKEKEEKERPRLDPIEGSGAVQKVIEGGDRSSDGSDSEVVVVDEATSDVDEGGDEKEVKEESKSEEKDTVTAESNSEEKAAKESEAEKEDSMKPVENEEDDFVFEENKIESAEPLETQEIPASVSAMNEGGDFFTGFDNNPNMGDKVRTEEFFFDDEEPVGEAVELEEAAEETTEEPVEEAVEETVEEAAEEKAEPVEEEKAEETVEETVEEAAEETVEEAVEEATEETVEEAAEETAEETVEEAAEETVEEAVEETTEEAVEETTEETIEETAEEKVEEVAEETAEEAAEETEEAVGTGFILDKKYSLLADAESKSLHVLSGVGPASNGLEGIILLPAQLDPMPMNREEEISAKAIIGKGTEMPVKLDRPFGNTDLFLWGEYIPGNDNADDLSEASLVLVRGKNSHIPNVSGKEELRKEVAKAKEVTGGTPIGISLVIGRIEQDLAACVYAGVDFVVLNDVSSGMLPYALRRAKNYLNHVNSEIELIVSIKDINDAKELAKLIALGADFILLEREYDEITIGQITQELKEIARNTGHKNVHDLNMLDICTIDSDLAKNTDIAHF